MRRPDPADADLPLRQRAKRQSRRELEKLLARARRAMQAFAASDEGNTEPRPKTPARARLLPVT